MKYTVLIPYKKKYISNYMLNDLLEIPNVTFEYLLNKEKISISRLQIVNRIAWSIYWRICVSRLVASIIKGNLRDEKIIVITNEMLIFLSANQIKKLQRNGVRIILIMIDPMSASYPTVLSAKRILNKVHFDLTFTFDPFDAEKNGWNYCNTLYSTIKNNSSIQNIDICYFGNIKDRLPIITSLLNSFKKNKIEYLFKLSGCDFEQKQQLPNDTVLEEVIGYEEIVRLTQKANCILDITQSNQVGVTFRYYEAVVYNKKLLTNNRAIVNMPFYDKRFMKIYDSIEDIDWEWVKKREIIDYGYNGEFSPVKLLGNIESLLQFEKSNSNC